MPLSVDTSAVLRAILERGTSPEVERRLHDAVALVWTGCEILELTPEVCELAGRIAPGTLLRTLAALHLATFVLARRQLEGLELLTADRRLADAAAAVA